MKVGELQVLLSLKTRNFQVALMGARGSLLKFKAGISKIGAGVKEIFDNIARAVKTSALVMGVALTGAIVVGAKFEDAMNRTFAIISGGASFAAEKMKELTDAARFLGRETLFSATKAAKGMEILALAGFKTGDIIKAIGPTLKMAIVGNLDLADATSITIAALKSYQMDASKTIKVTDILSKAATSANVTVGSLGEAMKFSAAIAHAMGVPMEDLAAAIGQMGNAGFKGSMAGASLRRAFAMMVKPTTSAKKIMDRLNITFTKAPGKLRPFVDIIGDLQKSSANAADLLELFGLRAGPAMTALVGMGAESLKKLQTELENSAGTADRMSEKFRETLKGRTLDIMSTLVDLGIAITDAFETSLADAVFGMRNWINEVIKALEENEKLTKIVTALKKGLRPLGQVFKDIGAAILSWIKNFDAEEFAEKIKKMTKSILSFKNKALGVFNNLKSLLEGVKGKVVLLTGAFLALGGTKVLGGIAQLIIAMKTLKFMSLGAAALGGTGIGAAALGGAGVGTITKGLGRKIAGAGAKTVSSGIGGVSFGEVAAGAGAGAGTKVGMGAMLAGAGPIIAMIMTAIAGWIAGWKLGPKIVDAFADLIDSFKEDVKPAKEVSDTIRKAIAESAGDIEKLNWNNIVDAIENGIESVKGGLNLAELGALAAFEKFNRPESEVMGGDVSDGRGMFPDNTSFGKAVESRAEMVSEFKEKVEEDAELSDEMIKLIQHSNELNREYLRKIAEEKAKIQADLDLRLNESNQSSEG